MLTFHGTTIRAVAKEPINEEVTSMDLNDKTKASLQTI